MTVAANATNVDVASFGLVEEFESRTRNRTRKQAGLPGLPRVGGKDVLCAAVNTGLHMLCSCGVVNVWWRHRLSRTGLFAGESSGMSTSLDSPHAAQHDGRSVTFRFQVRSVPCHAGLLRVMRIDALHLRARTALRCSNF